MRSPTLLRVGVVFTSMQSDVSIHKATEGDVESIHRVAERSWREAYDGILADETIDRILETGYAAGGIEDAIATSDTLLFVARADGGIRGYASTESTSITNVGNFGIYIDPDYWGDGIGTQLLERGAAELRDSGRTRLRDFVLQENAVGNAFYDEHFEHVGEESVEIGGERHPANVYEMDL